MRSIRLKHQIKPTTQQQSLTFGGHHGRKAAAQTLMVKGMPLMSINTGVEVLNGTSPLGLFWQWSPPVLQQPERS